MKVVKRAGVRRKAAKMFGNDFCHLTIFFFISISGLIVESSKVKVLKNFSDSIVFLISSTDNWILMSRFSIFCFFFSNFYFTVYLLLTIKPEIEMKKKLKKNSSNGRSHSQTFWRPFYEPLIPGPLLTSFTFDAAAAAVAVLVDVVGIHETGDVLGDCEHYGVECDGGKELSRE